MKTKQIIKITLSLLLIIGTFTACVEDKDYDTPQVHEEDNNIATTTLAAVKNGLIQNFQAGDPSTLVHTFPDLLPDNSNLLIASAYVIGDDTTGNFYKKLIVQDNAVNPTTGIEIRIDQGSLHTLYNVGRKIYIQLNGLTIGYYDGQQGGAPGYINQSNPTDGEPGVYKLGILGEEYSVDRISSLEFKKFIIRSSVSDDIFPKLISTDEISDDTMNTFVQFNNMQFELNELGHTFAGEQGDSFDASRFLINCETEYQFGLMTSTFSNFKELTLPDGKGDVKGVLMKNYRENDPVIVLNTPDDVNFTGTDRCDPVILDCGAGAVGTTEIFSQDFEGISDESDLIGLGWTNTNINGGSHVWIDRTFSGNRYMQLGAYNSNENPLESWLITPAINLDGTTDETFTFDVNVGYYRGAALSVYASTDFTGDVATATWQLIDSATLPTGPSSGYGSFSSAGNINVSCLEGDVYFAFKYAGADGGVTTTFQIDNIKVTGN